VVRAVGTIRGIESDVKIKVRTNVKGNGQECPFHTGGSGGSANSRFLAVLAASRLRMARNDNVDWEYAGVARLKSCPSRCVSCNRPRPRRREINCKIRTNVKSNGQECPFHTGGGGSSGQQIPPRSRRFAAANGSE